jgi:hypothetical protein
MGFTRYYEVKKKLNPEIFKEYSEKCKEICDIITEKWGHGLSSWNQKGEPEFLPDEVAFNGQGDNGGESFVLGVESSGFEFTKTNLRPYDNHVYACLLLAKEYFGDSIRVSSDASDDEESYEIKSLLIQFKRDKKLNTILEN